jgi:tetratricopeptide (TPR) repeat protein
LKDAAKEPLQKGLLAAQQQDWKLAIRYFLEAQKADTDAPRIWFNLGLASSKLPGYELRALAWFQAYLLAVPDGPNADAIRQQIATLEVAFESRMSKVIDAIEAVVSARLVAARRQALVEHSYSGLDLDTPIRNLASARAFLGDTSTAIRALCAFYSADAPDSAKCDKVAVIRYQKGKYNDVGEALFAGGYPLDMTTLAASRVGGTAVVLYFLEVGDFAGAQSFIETSKAEYKGFGVNFPFEWEAVACAAFDRHDQKTLHDALAKADAEAVEPDNRVFYAGTLFAVGQRDQARLVADDLVAKVSPKSIAAAGLADLLIALGDERRTNDLAGLAPGLRHEPTCNSIVRLGWTGRNRQNYLVHLAQDGVKLDDSFDETLLGEYLRRSTDTLSGTDAGASAKLASSISWYLLRLAEEYRRVHGPYGHLPKTCADPNLRC